jgi:hypothetical protein
MAYVIPVIILSFLGKQIPKPWFLKKNFL